MAYPRYPFPDLKVGDSFRVSLSDHTSSPKGLSMIESLKVMAYRWGRKLQCRFEVTRENTCYRVTHVYPALLDVPRPKPPKRSVSPALKTMSRKAQLAFAEEPPPLIKAKMHRRISVGNRVVYPRPANDANWIVDPTERFSLEITGTNVIFTRTA